MLKYRKKQSNFFILRQFFMQVNVSHAWNVSPAEAIQWQKKLSNSIRLLPVVNTQSIKRIAGVDVCYRNGYAIGGIVLFRYPELSIIDRQYLIQKITFPYISGLLTFREGPVLTRLFQKISRSPDVIIFDGQGIAHPRQMGIATHLGLFIDCPTIGCAKSRLVGNFGEPDQRKGHFSDLNYQGKTIGAVLRTKNNVKPVFISPGNHINLQQSIEIILNCIRQYRIPVPTRQAHLFVNQIKVEFFPSQTRKAD